MRERVTRGGSRSDTSCTRTTMPRCAASRPARPPTTRLSTRRSWRVRRCTRSSRHGWRSDPVQTIGLGSERGTMTIKRLQPDGVYELRDAGGRAYPQVIRVEGGTHVYLSGMVALDAGGELIGDRDMAAQARATYENISRALGRGGRHAGRHRLVYRLCHGLGKLPPPRQSHCRGILRRSPAGINSRRDLVPRRSRATWSRFR